MRILVLGVTGMLGHAVYRVLTESPGLHVCGTLRSAAARRRIPAAPASHLIADIDVEAENALAMAFAQARPDVVVNCVGLVKQMAEADDPLRAIPINALLPHRLAALCRSAGARLVHVSTDCVFSGSRGAYTEADSPDAADLYGRSKLLGEVDSDGALTLRTSIIGPELASARGLLGWFLAQRGPIKGYTRAIFSGLPTVELATIIRDVVLPRPDLYGLYHVGAAPISKFALLELLARQYDRPIEIVPDGQLVLDRSLVSERFAARTGYRAPDWPELVRRMHAFG